MKKVLQIYRPYFCFDVSGNKQLFCLIDQILPHLLLEYLLTLNNKLFPPLVEVVPVKAFSYLSLVGTQGQGNSASGQLAVA